MVNEPVVAIEKFAMTVTEHAAVKIQSILQERGVPDHGLRVFVSGGGCSGLQFGMALESQAQDQDQVIQVNGLKLYVDATSAEYLDAATIDYQEGPMASGFRIDAPHAVASSCGCGSNDASSGCGCGGGCN
jgi:iron-sulfur cluster assembly protein